MSEQGEIHAALHASVRAFAEREGGIARARAARDRAPGFDRDVWRKMATLGWVGLLLPEQIGGSGLRLTEMAIVVRELGRWLAPEPLTATAVLAARALLHAGAAGPNLRLSRAIVRGDTLPAVAWQETLGVIDAEPNETTATDNGSGIVLRGVKRFVADGAGADGFLVSARSMSGVGLYWAAKGRRGLSYVPQQRADATEHGTLTLHDVSVDSDDVIATADHGAQALSRALNEATVIAGAELLGIAERALEITLDYLRTRQQFGRPIGSFQALQHRCVDLFIQKELCVSALEAALARADSADPRERAVLASRVKARCADSALAICREAIQMHGAIGFTDECDIGLYLKRALHLAAWLGNAHVHRRRYAALTLTRAPVRAPGSARGACHD